MENNRLRNVVIMALLLMTTLVVGTGTVYAGKSSLSVKAILLDNQFNKDVSYYYLQMTPGQKQEIELQLFNSSDQDVTALVTLTAASTNDNGLIDYHLPDKEFDESLRHPFPTFATTPKEVKVPANKDVTTTIAIEMPEESYSGMIIGGINITTKKEESAKSKESGGMKIANQLNYAIGVILIENEEPVTTDMQLLTVFAGQVMGNNTMKATLQNPAMAVMENVTIDAKIYATDSKTVLYETKKENYRMAPNSSFDFGIPLGQEPYKAGTYRLKLTAVSEPKDPKDGQRQEWHFDETFTVKRIEAEQLNATAMDLGKDRPKYYLLAIPLVIVVAVIVAVIVSINRTKKRQERRTKSKAGTGHKAKKRLK